MAIEVTSESAICFKCGIKYGNRKGAFYVSYALPHKGVGRLPICKNCLEAMYGTYLSQCNDAKAAVRQVCRKLDLYWSEDVYEQILKKSTSRTVMAQYLTRINSVTHAGKSYDDTLCEEGTLWNFTNKVSSNQQEQQDDHSNTEELAPEEEDFGEDITDDVIAFWGKGYSNSMYRDLEQRRQYWMERLGDDFEFDMGTEALIRQICPLEIDINRDRAAGKPVDKSVNILNTLLGSANLKPAQRKNDQDVSADNTPFGVWVRKWETHRPIPKPDPDLEDVDGLLKYILTWVYGHLAKMLNIKNVHSPLYDQAIEQLRVEHPEFDDEDDETMLYDVFASDDDEEGADG